MFIEGWYGEEAGGGGGNMCIGGGMVGEGGKQWGCRGRENVR